MSWRLWKSVEINRLGGWASAYPTVRGGIAPMNKRSEEFVLGACSACAGDYEDPDRTARTPTERDDEKQCDVLNAGIVEFPAEE
jgi:hypothetical protein